MNWQKWGGHGEIWHSVTGLADCDVLCTDSPGAWVKRWRRSRVRLRLNKRTCLITTWTTSLIDFSGALGVWWAHLTFHLFINQEGKFAFILHFILHFAFILQTKAYGASKAGLGNLKSFLQSWSWSNSSTCSFLVILKT